MNSDAVNSISDTVESEQIALIVRDTYQEMIVSRRYLDLKKFVNLIPSTDIQYPTYMKVPENVGDVIEIRHNNRKLRYMQPDKFVELLRANRPESEHVFVMKEKDTEIDLPVVTNADPEYWTTFNDEDIIFNSYEKTEQDTVLHRDMVAYAEVFPTFELTNTFVPKLPIRAFPLLLAEAKSKAFADIKQMASPKEEQKARRLRSYMSTNKNTLYNGPSFPNYGRK